MSWDVESFKSKLEDQHTFPGNYTFKFIVPLEKQHDLLAVIPKDAEIVIRESSGGKYISITGKSHLPTSEAVLDVYFAANKIEGCIAL